MRLPRSAAVLPSLEWLASTESTNAVLSARLRSAGESLPHGATIVTADQTAGRGRLGRGWVTPPGTALAISVLIRDFGISHDVGQRSGSSDPGATRSVELPVSWLPLVAGSAVSAALQPLFGEGMRVGVKWPNDVHVRDEADAEAGRPGRKLCGILCEMVTPDAVVVGMGVNLFIPETDLPTDRATSVLAAGGEVGGARRIDEPAGLDLADRVVSAIGSELLQLAERAATEPGEVRSRVRRNSLTLGAEVRVHLPAGEVVDGRAVALADDGSLVVDLPTGGQLTVSAADVEHLR